MTEDEGMVNKGIKGLGTLLGKLKKPENKDTQRIYIDVPNSILQKYLPSILKDILELEERSEQ